MITVVLFILMIVTDIDCCDWYAWLFIGHQALIISMLNDYDMNEYYQLILDNFITMNCVVVQVENVMVIWQPIGMEARMDVISAWACATHDYARSRHAGSYRKPDMCIPSII